ncbi:endonuclease/exonuclease/phosphatase family protein [Mycoplasmatota bacterium]|nr:endonuclease/exonuclease/phosphatase family protein [Mycoplasmatota bacterium]
MRKGFKIAFIVFSVFIIFILGFILTLHLFEYKPEEMTELTIIDGENTSDSLNITSQITALTFNTGYASLSQTEDFVMDGGKKARMDSKSEVEDNIQAIEDILERENADIFLLQEVDVDSNRSYNINQYEIYQESLGITSALAYNYRSIFVPFPINPSQMMGKVNSGLATFTSFETSQATRIQLPGSFPWPVRLANLKRALLITRHPIEDSQAELVVINLHLSAYDDGSMREQELEALQEIMLEEKEKGNYILVGGDFNQTFPDALKSFESQSEYEYHTQYELNSQDLWEAYPLDIEWFNNNQFQLIADALIPTCRLLHQPYDTENHENNQYYLIDGFIVSNNITVNSIETIDEDFKYSDHNPVKITLTLNE